MLAQRPAGFSLRRLERCSRARRGAWTLVSTTQRQLLVLGGCLHKLDARQEFSALRRGREDVSSDGEAPRRRRLLCATLLAALVAAPARPAAAATAGLDDGPSTDVVEGAQHLVDLGVQALEVQLSEAPGRGAPVAEKLSEQRQRFGIINVPGLSSFSFIHGLIVGCVALALFASFLLPSSSSDAAGAGSSGGSSGGQSPNGTTVASGLDPELEAALRGALADAGPTFHDPEVHEAIQEVRRDISAIAKYKDNKAVMLAFSKLLEIEGILERL